MVYHARHEAEKVVYESIDHKLSDIFRLANQMWTTFILELATAIIHNGKVRTDKEQSCIVCLYMDNGDALDKFNYRGLKQTGQAMKITERTGNDLIRQVVI